MQKLLFVDKKQVTDSRSFYWRTVHHGYVRLHLSELKLWGFAWVQAALKFPDTKPTLKRANKKLETVSTHHSCPKCSNHRDKAFCTKLWNSSWVIIKAVGQKISWCMHVGQKMNNPANTYLLETAHCWKYVLWMRLNVYHIKF